MTIDIEWLRREFPNFDPADWDPAPDRAVFVRPRDGREMAYEFFLALEAQCTPEQREKARKVRDAALAWRCREVTAQHLCAIGKAAGFEDGGRAFAWQSLVDHVMRKLEAAK